ncbi:hypothetical protein ONZ45_g15919 [Pleurotus djamor]|nr:hypothetical protein ONZ45_g15919 [Pleurotus djamor]
MLRSLLVISSLISSTLVVHALRNGVGKLPFTVLGYNTWYAYQVRERVPFEPGKSCSPVPLNKCAIDEDLVLQDARQIKSLGLLDAGYNYINLDDCYAEFNRSANGDIVEGRPLTFLFPKANCVPLASTDHIRFSRGMKNFTGQLRELGFKAGIYSDSGWFTCAGYPGSFQNELRDARTFQDWGFDFLKYDNCNIPYDSIIRQGLVGKYQRMADALEELSKRTRRPPFIFSLCEWGRTTDDIAPDWEHIANVINMYAPPNCFSIPSITFIPSPCIPLGSDIAYVRNSFITQSTDFYGHNDMDILQLGRGDFTIHEAKSHFTAWALMKSPLLISTNMSAITQETLDIFLNKEILAINQDPVVGTSISPFRWGVNPNFSSNSSFPAQYWSGRSQNGTVFMLLNTLNEPADMFFNLTESPWIRAGRQYSVRDYFGLILMRTKLIALSSGPIGIPSKLPVKRVI